METKHVHAIFEAGTLRPLAPLDLIEQERVELTIVRNSSTLGDSDETYVPHIAGEANATVTLAQVQSALAKITGSLVDDFSNERDERF